MRRHTRYAPSEGDEVLLHDVAENWNGTVATVARVFTHNVQVYTQDGRGYLFVPADRLTPLWTEGAQS